MIAATEQPLNKKALAWTIGVHAVLLLLFLLWRYTPPVNAPVQEMGMEVNLGTSDNGSGTDQPMSTENPAEPTVAVATKSSGAQSEAVKDMLQSNQDDAPAVSTTTTNNKQRNTTATDQPKKVVATQQTVNDAKKVQQERPRYVYNGGTGRGGNGAMQDFKGTSEGNTTGSGDRGVPYGTPGASNYVGSPGNGNGGINHTLQNRNIIAWPPPDAEFKEQGKVTLRITVNRDGVITSKKIVSASSDELKAIALRKADKVRFNKSDDAPPEQIGSITFVFKTRS